jgi:single-strand DNA-binding protein
MNNFTGIGNLGSNPTLRTTPSGGNVTNFSVAIDRKFYRGTGENRTLVKETDWIPVVCWGSLATTCSNYLQKGSKVAVSGSVRPRTYTDSNGNTRSTFEIIASEIEFLDRIRSTTEGTSPQA